MAPSHSSGAVAGVSDVDLDLDLFASLPSTKAPGALVNTNRSGHGESEGSMLGGGLKVDNVGGLGVAALLPSASASPAPPSAPLHASAPSKRALAPNLAFMRKRTMMQQQQQQQQNNNNNNNNNSQQQHEEEEQQQQQRNQHQHQHQHRHSGVIMDEPTNPTDELYDPLIPNEYTDVVAERERLALEAEQKQKAAFAFPKPLKDKKRQAEGSMSKAAAMMKAMGWSEGKGLGKDTQGMVEPLVHRKLDARTGVIVPAPPSKKPRST